MLARVANSLYWTGRYIERSEHLARFLRVQYFSMLDAPMSQNSDFILKSVLNMYGMEYDPDAPVDEAQVLKNVGLNPDNPSSILATVTAARENARSLRYLLSTELWEVINQYYLFVKEYPVDFFQTRGLYDFTINAGKHCAIVRSYADHTLVHDEIWTFIFLGIHLERAAQIIRILKSKLHDIELISQNGTNLPLQRYQWTITLKVLEGFDMHRRIYREPQTQRSTFDFLISNPLFPRSLAYSIHQINDLISKLTSATKSDSSLLFKAGKLSSYFLYLEYNEIKDDLPRFLHQSLNQVYSLHELIESEYFE